MTRKPIVAGQFYEGDAEQLRAQIKGCFLNSPGPGMLPGKSSERLIKGAIVPHAGYMFSGFSAAHAYKQIAESKAPDSFIIIGTSHTGGYSSISPDDYETPLGTVKLDKKLSLLLTDHTELVEDAAPHMQEHSVEVQLPFLQFIYKNLKVVPIVVGHTNPVKLGAGIKEALKEYGRHVCVLASGDFTHFGFNYGYRPFSDNIKENLEKLDNGAFAFIENKDTKGFLSYIEKTGATICGKYPVATLIESIDFSKVTKLSHYSSGDISGDYNSCCDYISAVFE